MHINSIQQNNYNPKISNQKINNKNAQHVTSPVRSAALNYSNTYYNDLIFKNVSFGSTTELEAIKTTSKSAPKRKNRVPIAQDFRTVSEYKKFTPDVYQKEAIENLIAGNDVIVSAPTGTGKTLIAEEIILENLRKEMLLQNLKKGKQTFYTAPLKAVVDAKFKDFQKEFGKNNVARLTGDYKTEDALKYPVVVMTTEVYRNMMLARKAKGQSFQHPESTVVFDELHYMGDAQRGSVWEEAIMLSPPKTQILGLSATISNDKKLVHWIQDIHTAPDKKAVLVSVPRENRHVPLHYFAYNPNEPNTIMELEQEGISSGIFQDNSTLNENISPTQREAINQLNEIYSQNSVIKGHKVLNRINRNYAPKSVSEFENAIGAIAAKANVTISPQAMQLITNSLISDNKLVQAALKKTIREYDFKKLAPASELDQKQIAALEYLGELSDEYKTKGLLQPLHRNIVPTASAMLNNINGVNNQQVNFNQTVENIKQALRKYNIPNSDKIAEKISKPFKVRKPNPLIDFINTITINKESLFSDENAESIIQRRLEMAFKKQGLSEAQQKEKAAKYVEEIRKAFCAHYNNPRIDTISKALKHSDSQYITKHLIDISALKNIDADKARELKQRFTPEQVKLLSLYGFISGNKLRLNVRQLQDIDKQAYNDTNFLKGARLISSYSHEKIKTRESFISQIISPRFTTMKKVLEETAKRIEDATVSTVEERQNARELRRFTETELTPEKISLKSGLIMDAMLEKAPESVIRVKKILNTLITKEEARQALETEPEHFMFRLPKEGRYDEAQYAQIKALGEALIYKKSDHGIYVQNKLQNSERSHSIEELREELLEKMVKANVSDAPTKVDAIIKTLVTPLSPEEIEAKRALKVAEISGGKITLKATDLSKIKPEQADALKELMPLYEYLNAENKFIQKSNNSAILNMINTRSKDMGTEHFEKELAEILVKIEEPDAQKKAADLTTNLKSKVLHQDLAKDSRISIGTNGSGINYVRNLVETLNNENKLPAIFFIFSRKQCEDSLKECTKENCIDLLTKQQKEEAQAIINKYVQTGELLDRNFKSQKELLLKGYAVHHAGRMPGYKNLVQELSEKGLIRVTFATETLAAGINFPTRTTVITKLLKPESDSAGKIQSRFLKASEFQQMAGRAGRRGYDTEGFCVIVGNGSSAFEEAVDLAERVPEAIKSHYKPSYGLIANLLMHNPNIQDLDTHFAKSFLVEEGTSLDGKEKVQMQLQGRTNDIMEIMLENGYLEKIDNYGKFKVTAKGQIAALAKGVNEILLTDLITDPKMLNLNAIDSSMFAGIISSISYDSSGIHDKLNSKSAKIIKDEYNATEAVMKEILDKNITNKIDEIVLKEKKVQNLNPLITDSSSSSLKRSFISFNKWMAPFVYKWTRYPAASNTDAFWNEMTGNMKDGGLLKDSADFTRTVHNTVDLLQQVESIADYIDSHDLFAELNMDPVRLSHIRGLAQKAQAEIMKQIEPVKLVKLAIKR